MLASFLDAKKASYQTCRLLVERAAPGIAALGAPALGAGPRRGSSSATLAFAVAATQAQHRHQSQSEQRERRWLWHALQLREALDHEQHLRVDRLIRGIRTTVQVHLRENIEHSNGCKIPVVHFLQTGGVLER